MRLAALALGTAPLLSWSGGTSGWRPFEGLEVIDRLFERAPGAWFFCWLLPFVASLRSLRSEFMTSLFTFIAYLSLLISLMCSWVPGLLVGVQGLGVVALAMLLIARVETEVVAAWARILLSAVLLLACILEWRGRPYPNPGLVGVWIGGLLSIAGEVWALRSGPPEEPSDEDPA